MKNSMRKKCPYQICEKLSSIFRHSSSINHPWEFHRFITICNFRRYDDIMQLSLQKSGIFRDIGEKNCTWSISQKHDCIWIEHVQNHTHSRLFFKFEYRYIIHGSIFLVFNSSIPVGPHFFWFQILTECIILINVLPQIHSWQHLSGNFDSLGKLI